MKVESISDIYTSSGEHLINFKEDRRPAWEIYYKRVDTDVSAISTCYSEDEVNKELENIKKYHGDMLESYRIVSPNLNDFTTCDMPDYGFPAENIKNIQFLGF